jgi:hypothetical protein
MTSGSDRPPGRQAAGMMSSSVRRRRNISI